MGYLQTKEEIIQEEVIKEVTANIQNIQLEEIDDINEMWNKINKKKIINEATGKTIGKQKDHKEIVDLMKNVKYYSKIKRKLTTKWVTEIPDTMNKNVHMKEKKHMNYLDRKESIV